MFCRDIDLGNEYKASRIIIEEEVDEEDMLLPDCSKKTLQRESKKLVKYVDKLGEEVRAPFIAAT